jgi:hypothetical protein
MSPFGRAVSIWTLLSIGSSTKKLLNKSNIPLCSYGAFTSFIYFGMIVEEPVGGISGEIRR